VCHHADHVAFQLILFNHRANLLLDSSHHALLRALDRWEQLWDAAIKRLTPEEQKWLGVARYAPEFALVSRRILEVSADQATPTSEYLRCAPQYDLEKFHQFLLDHG
jgi:hypothetical protein